MQIELNGKTALVTGSTAGIGYAIGRSLAACGARVVINGRSEDKTASAVRALRDEFGTDAVLGAAADLATAEGADALVEEVGPVDILVNNIGIFEPRPFLDIADEDWTRFFETNVMSGVRLSRKYLPMMMDAGWGRIVFISSESALNVPAEMIHYGMTKTAQLVVSRGLAELAAGSGVTVNSVLPGPTRSEGVAEFLNQMARDRGQTLDQFEADFFAEHRPTSLIKRFATVEEVANLVTYVVSEQASATSGAALRVDGGLVRSIA